MKKPKLVVTHMDKVIAELVSKSDHKILAIWAADCAERVLPYFEQKSPDDNRPRKAIDALRRWIKTGCLKWPIYEEMHLQLLCLLVRWKKIMLLAGSAGHALATAHVPTHALVASTYAATAIRDATESTNAVAEERRWQYQHLLKLQIKLKTSRLN